MACRASRDSRDENHSMVTLLSDSDGVIFGDNNIGFRT